MRLVAAVSIAIKYSVAIRSAITLKLYRDFTTQDEIDDQYQIERQVEDPAYYRDFFVNESAAARNELDCHLDVRFGPTVAETVDIFPAADPNAPIVVFIHGGYWRRLSSKEFSLVARGTVARGITMVVTNYALCPRVTIPEITRQSRAALAWLYQSELKFNGSRERIFVSGHSAGGHQVARLLETDWAGDYGLPQNFIRGGFSISGLFDLRPLRYSWLQPMIQLTDDIINAESPQLHEVPQKAPYLFASVGGDESPEFHRQSTDYIAAWNAAGLEGEYDSQVGKNHFSAIDGFADPDSRLCQQLVDFIARCEG
ncbi:MAG: alpha/beta hydrolase [Pseudomonadota bacterium]